MCWNGVCRLTQYFITRLSPYITPNSVWCVDLPEQLCEKHMPWWKSILNGITKYESLDSFLLSIILSRIVVHCGTLFLKLIGKAHPLTLCGSASSVAWAHSTVAIDAPRQRGARSHDTPFFLSRYSGPCDVSSSALSIRHYRWGGLQSLRRAWSVDTLCNNMPYWGCFASETTTSWACLLMPAWSPRVSCC